MSEQEIVCGIVRNLLTKGYLVATEVANLYRSADIAVIDDEENIWIIECKISHIGRAIEQTRIHKLAADKVYVGTPYKNTRKQTFELIKKAGIGLIYLMPDNSMHIVLDPKSTSDPWPPARRKLRNRIIKVA